MYRKEDLADIIINQDALAQLDVAQEERAELIQAISKFKRNRLKPSKARKNKVLGIIEEVADVQIVLNQLRILFDITDEILLDEIDYKIDRQLKRLEKSKCNI